MFSSSANSALCCAVGCVQRDIERPIGLAAGPNRTNFVRGPPMTSGDPRGSFGPPDRVARLAGNPIVANTVRVVCTAQHIWPVRARTAQQNTELMKKKRHRQPERRPDPVLCTAFRQAGPDMTTVRTVRLKRALKKSILRGNIK